MIGQAIFLSLFASSYVVSHAWSIRVTRALEAGGRLRGRGTVLVFAGPLLISAVCIAFFVVWIIQGLAGFEAMDYDAMSEWDYVAVGIATLMTIPLGGWASHRVAVALPQRRRGQPPVGTLRSLAPLLQWTSRAILPVLFVGLTVAYVAGWRNNPPQSWDNLWLVLLVPLSFKVSFYYGTRGRRKLHEFAEQWSDPTRSDEPVTLYLRPFNEERTLFAEGRTLEEFLGPEIRARIGEFVGLGSPQDRLPPTGGARRAYYSDQSWQGAAEELAQTARCIIVAMASSANTSWELARIRELGLQSKLFMVSPPSSAVEDGDDDPIGGSTGSWRFVAAVAKAYLDMDADRITKILARGHTPRALTASTTVAWQDLTDELSGCGYTVSIDDPGPGAVVGFDSAGATVILTRAAADPSDFIKPMAAQVG